MMNADAVLPSSYAWLIIGLFSLLWVWLGWRLGRNNDTLEDYMLAGRKVGMGFAVATAMVTWVTSNTTMTAPQLAYQLGIWGMVGYSLGAVGLILFAPLARRIREMMPEGYTSGDFIRLRYGNTAWRIFLVISFFYSLGWLISLGMAGGLLINALSGIPYVYGMTVIVVICTLYTVFGGLKAVIGTDFVQTILILLGVIALAVLVINEVGFDAIHAQLETERPELLNLLLPASIMFLFNNLFFGVGLLRVSLRLPRRPLASMCRRPTWWPRLWRVNCSGLRGPFSCLSWCLRRWPRALTAFSPRPAT